MNEKIQLIKISMKIRLIVPSKDILYVVNHISYPDNT